MPMHKRYDPSQHRSRFLFLTRFQCWLGSDTLSLPDMNTELDTVKAVWDQWAQDLVANYSSQFFKNPVSTLRMSMLTLNTSVDGMRIDAAKHVAKPFWTQFQPYANVYTVGEALPADA